MPQPWRRRERSDDGRSEKRLLRFISRGGQNFGEALIAPKSELSRDAAIKRFELAFELSWKLLQKHLREQGLDCQSPKSCFQAGLANKLITDEALATIMIADRNFSVHTYNEKFAEELLTRLPKYQVLFEDLIQALSE